MEINEVPIGPGQPCYIIAEIGINHNGDLMRAIELMQAAKYAGAQAVKFQKRTLDLVVPVEKREQIRYDTPWGDISYWDYKEHLEFDFDDYAHIKLAARQAGLAWFASPWDIPSVEFLEELEPDAMKIASAGITNLDLVAKVSRCRKPVIFSTGMSDGKMIMDAAECIWENIWDRSQVAVLQCTGTYPTAPKDINLRAMQTLRNLFPFFAVGFSNHSPGLTHCQNAVALGADIVEAHITLDRSGWGSDQASSIEPHGFRQLVGRIRSTELALGDGKLRIYPSEQAKIGDLRP